ncbi:MAG: tetratricopeptide repeat protein [Methylomonas sp.]|jgi:tetratricopeptide (TPR) repeat protein
MTSTPQIVLVKIDDFDLTQLPAEHRDITAPSFNRYLREFLELDNGKNGYFTNITVNNEYISFEPDTQAKEQSDDALDALQRGNYPKGKKIFEELLPKYPKNIVVLYNLGLVYSDEGNLKRAIELLSTATAVHQEHAHAWTALAIAYMRNSNLEKAIEAANAAFEIAEDDPYVLRTAGSLMAQAGNTKDALRILEKAAQVAPTDSITLFSLAECLIADDKEANKQRADGLYKKVMELAPGSPQADRAADRRREFAYQGFRKTGDLRQDAVMFCLDALKDLKGKSPQEIAAVAMEAATLGEGGLSVDDPTQKYQLRTLPGTYSGLNVVCILHTAVQQVAPGNDSGFDIKAEYEEALKLFGKNT